MKKVPQLQRHVLRVNNRTGVVSEFRYDPVQGQKSIAEPSIVTWGGPGRGVSGETVNATNAAAKQIVNRNWKPIQS